MTNNVRAKRETKAEKASRVNRERWEMLARLHGYNELAKRLCPRNPPSPRLAGQLGDLPGSRVIRRRPPPPGARSERTRPPPGTCP